MTEKKFTISLSEEERQVLMLKYFGHNKKTIPKEKAQHLLPLLRADKII